MKKTLLLAATSLALFSCTLDNDIPLDDMVSVSLGFTMAAPTQIVVGEELIQNGINPQTKTTSPPLAMEENKIKNLWILQFEPSYGSDGSLTPSSPDDPLIPTASILKHKVYTDAFQIGAEATRSIINLMAHDTEDVKYELRFVTNVGAGTFSRDTPVSSRYSLQDFNEDIILPAAVTTNHIPMVGSASALIKKTAKIVDENGNTTPNVGIMNEIKGVKLHRLYCKVKFNYTIEDAWQGGSSGNPTWPKLEAKQVKLYNYPTEIPLNREEKRDSGSKKVSTSSTPEVKEAIAIGGTSTFFLPQRISGIINSYYNNKDGYDADGVSEAKLSYIELETSYQQSATDTPEIVRFKIYLGGNNSNNYNVLSNHEYTITTNISDIDRSGENKNVEVVPAAKPLKH